MFPEDQRMSGTVQATPGQLFSTLINGLVLLCRKCLSTFSQTEKNAILRDLILAQMPLLDCETFTQNDDPR